MMPNHISKWPASWKHISIWLWSKPWYSSVRVPWTHKTTHKMDYNQENIVLVYVLVYALIPSNMVHILFTKHHGFSWENGGVFCQRIGDNYSWDRGLMNQDHKPVFFWGDKPFDWISWQKSKKKTAHHAVWRILFPSKKWWPVGLTPPQQNTARWPIHRPIPQPEPGESVDVWRVWMPSPNFGPSQIKKSQVSTISTAQKSRIMKKKQCSNKKLDR